MSNFAAVYSVLRQHAGQPDFDARLAQLRRDVPSAFHTADTLSTRVFFDQPIRGEPCCGFVRSRDSIRPQPPKVA